MKKFFIIFFLIVFTLSFCTKKSININEFHSLITDMNKRFDSFKLVFNIKNVISKEIDDFFTELTIKKAKLLFDTSSLKKLNPLYKSKKIVIHTDSITLKYKNDTKEFFLTGINGLKTSVNLYEIIELKKKDIENMVFNYNINVENLNFNNYNITPVLKKDKKDSKEKDDIFNTITKLSLINKKIETSVKNINLNFDFDVKDKADPFNMKVDFNIEEYKSITSLNPLLIKLLTFEDIKNLKNKIKDVKYLFNVNDKSKNVIINLKIDDKEIARIYIDYFELKDKLINSNGFYNFSFIVSLNNLKIDTNYKKIPQKIRKLLQLKNYKFRFSLKNIFSDLLFEYFDIIKLGKKLSKKNNNIKNSQINQYGFKLLGLVTSSKPIIELAINFNHPLGELDMDSHFQVVGLSLPNGYAKIYIKNIKLLLEKLKEMNLIKDKDIKNIYSGLKNYFVYDNNGNANLNLKINNNMIFLNNKRIK